MAVGTCGGDRWARATPLTRAVLLEQELHAHDSILSEAHMDMSTTTCGYLGGCLRPRSRLPSSSKTPQATRVWQRLPLMPSH